MVIVDTSAILAFVDKREPDHPIVRATLEQLPAPFVVSPFVLAEVDYLVLSRHGIDREIPVLKEFSSGAWQLAPVDTTDVQAATSVVERYSDQQIGLADASLVVLADRYQTRTIATLDRRHFTLLRPLRGGRFRIVP